MEYKHKLTKELIVKTSQFNEFANGAAQATVILKDGKHFNNALISNSTALVALRGFKSLPFQITDIADIFQTEEDINPKERNSWEYWDEWK